MSKLRVLLVDDHPIVRNGLKVLVHAEADMDVVGEAFDGETAVVWSRELRPDVVVMDVSMPGIGGTKATAQIREDRPEVRVVALTAYEDRGYVRQLMSAGASGYVLKRSAAANLVTAIRHAAAGNKYLDPAVAGRAAPSPVHLSEDNRQGLNEREEHVLKEIALGYSNK